MADDFKALIERLRQQLGELEPERLAARLEQGEAPRVLDIREREEWQQGHLPDSEHLPRGVLEQRIERLEPDRGRELVLVCAVGQRSLLACRSLRELGYQHVASLAGGFERWKREGRAFEIPELLQPTQLDRYLRHTLLPEVGEAGQLRLARSRVLVVGVGGLGCPAALYLAAAGVGTLGLVDADRVELSNLQRQVLHTERRIGQPKVESAALALNALNPELRLELHPCRLEAGNVMELLQRYQLVIDGSDNFPTRYLLNDASVLGGVPVVHGSVHRFEGQLTLFEPGHGPCYRCLFPQPPPAELAPNCAEAGVLGVLPGVIGLLQATEALKFLLGIGRSLRGRLLLYDALATSFRELAFERDPACAMCGDRPTITRIEPQTDSCGAS